MLLGQLKEAKLMRWGEMRNGPGHQTLSSLAAISKCSSGMLGHNKGICVAAGNMKHKWLGHDPMSLILCNHGETFHASLL